MKPYKILFLLFIFVNICLDCDQPVVNYIWTTNLIGTLFASQFLMIQTH
jgi:hypothetical protein